MPFYGGRGIRHWSIFFRQYLILISVSGMLCFLELHPLCALRYRAKCDWFHNQIYHHYTPSPPRYRQANKEYLYPYNNSVLCVICTGCSSVFTCYLHVNPCQSLRVTGSVGYRGPEPVYLPATVCRLLSPPSRSIGT